MTLIVNNLEKSSPLICRPSELSRVFLNLLNNAFDAVANLPEKWIKVDISDSDTCTEISVTDSGHGISKEVSDKMFNPFFTTKETGKGTGLGLSISVAIVQVHNGKMYLDSECPNTRFVVEIPKGLGHGGETTQHVLNKAS